MPKKHTTANTNRYTPMSKIAGIVLIGAAAVAMSQYVYASYAGRLLQLQNFRAILSDLSVSIRHTPTGITQMLEHCSAVNTAPFDAVFDDIVSAVKDADDLGKI